MTMFFSKHFPGTRQILPALQKIGKFCLMEFFFQSLIRVAPKNLILEVQAYRKLLIDDMFQGGNYVTCY